MNTKTLLVAIILCSVIPAYAQTINGGNGHSIMLCQDSSVWTVGLNSIGQLGDGTTINKLIPIEVSGLTNIVSVQAGASHCLALKSDGTVWSWGNNTSGQLGNNSTDSSLVPIQVPGLSNVVKIIAGASHNVAIESDSTAWIWGDNQLNQINGTSTNKLFPISTGANIVDIAAGSSYTSKLFQDSTVRIVSNGTKFMNISGVVFLGSGYNHTFMVKSDNTIWAWGNNQYGQLGDSTTISQGTTASVQVVGLNNIISITGGQRHSMALRSDGTVWTWGWNGLGQLGNNTLVDELTPIQVPGLDSVIEIAAGNHYCMAKRSDSTIWVWGSNISGQLGNDTAINTTIPVQMMLSCIPFQCPAPQIYLGGDLEICSGDSVIVFGTYQQLANNYYDSLTTPNGCDSIIQIALIIDPLPTVSFTGLDSFYCINSGVDFLVGSPSGGVFSGTGIAGGVFDPMMAGFGTFTVNYSYTDGNGCTDTQSQSVTVSTCTGIENLRVYDFKIYPNPSSGIINIKTNKPIEITNTLGQVIYYKNGNSQIDLSEYGEGIYFVKVGNAIKKLVITSP